MVTWNAIAVWMLLSTPGAVEPEPPLVAAPPADGARASPAASSEPAAAALPAAPPELGQVQATAAPAAAPRSVIWVGALAGGPGRASLGYERALGSHVSLWFELLGGAQLGGLTNLSQGTKTSQSAAVGMVGGGLRVFPLGGAPFGPWVGAELHGGVESFGLEVQGPEGDVPSTGFKGTLLLGEGGLQAGYSLHVWKGFALHGALGAAAYYARFVEGLSGGVLTFGLTTWLGLGYAF